MGQRAGQCPLSEKESRGTHLRGSPSLNGSLRLLPALWVPTAERGVPCIQNTAWGQPVSTATLGGRLGARPARRALTPYCTSKSREETDRRLAENIMKGGLGRAVKKSLGQRGKQRRSKRSRIGSAFTFYHAQWATSRGGGLASVHLGDGCQSTVVGALGSVTPPAARGLRSTSEWPPCPPPHWISSETESQTS